MPVIVGNTPQPSRKRTKFSHVSFSDSNFEFMSPVSTDELYVYLRRDISSFNLNRDSFLEKDMSMVLFWYNMQTTFPVLFTDVRRIYATPGSSCASERVL